MQIPQAIGSKTFSLLRQTLYVLRALLLATPLTLAIDASATTQLPEEIVIDGESHAMITEPLADYLSADERRIETLKNFSKYQNSGLWRGYIGHWRISDGKLQLESLRTDGATIPLSAIFDKTSGPIHASWYSGELVLPQGKVIQMIHMGYATRYERYRRIVIKDGLVVRSFISPDRPPNP